MPLKFGAMIYMKNRNILITGGGLGFIGSHIPNMLMKDNNVVIVDDLSTGNIDNILNPDHEKPEDYLKGHLRIDWDEVLDGVDYIFHLAAMASVPLSIDEPVRCNTANLDTTVSYLRVQLKMSKR